MSSCQTLKAPIRAASDPIARRTTPLEAYLKKILEASTPDGHSQHSTSTRLDGLIVKRAAAAFKQKHPIPSEGKGAAQ